MFFVLQQQQLTEMDLSTEVATRLTLVDREVPPFDPPGAKSAHATPLQHSEEKMPQLTKVTTTLSAIFAVLSKREY